MNNKTVSIIVACYAAFVSTISLIWNIVNDVKQNKSKLKVSAYITAHFDAIPGVGPVSETT